MFSVVIPTIGRTSLEELLNSIPSSPLLVSVIVVGDARMATEQADAIAANLQLRTRFEIKWRRPVQPGVNAARNLGIQEVAADSRTEVLVFFDDDVVLSDFFSWEALRDVYKDAAVLAVGGNYISRDHLDFHARGYNLMCSGWRVASGYEKNEALLGGAWCIRLPEMLQVCRDLGWFEEDILYGGAETPFMHRLRAWAAGNWSIVYNRHLDVFHHPRNRSLRDWLRIASTQRRRLDEATMAARPVHIVRLRRLFLFCLSLTIAELVTFFAFTIPFVVSGYVAALFSNVPKSR